MDPYSRSIAALEKANCDYVIIGGFSVVMHGGNRFTPDINLVISFNKENPKKVISALMEAKFIPKDENAIEILSSESERKIKWDKNEFFLTFFDEETPNFRVEILLNHTIVLEELLEFSQHINLETTNARICSLEHLIKMKKDLSRAQDNMDIDSLNIASKIISLSEDEQIEFIKNSESAFEREQKESLTEFSKETYSQRLEWLASMLTHLGKFCMLGA